MKIKFDVTLKEIYIIKDILENYLNTNCKVWVFGSRAKSTSLFNSDLDLALECQSKIELRTMTKIKIAFEDSRLPYSVDIIDINAIKPYFKDIVDKEKIPFPLNIKERVPELRFGEFSKEWEEKKLREVTTYVDYRGRAPIKTEKGHFLVTAKNIKKGFIDYECSKEYVAESDYLNVMSKGLPKVGDVLFTTEAPMGNVAQVDDTKIALAQRVIKFRSKEMLSNFYLLHYMISPIFQKIISTKSIGTTVQGISGKELHKIKLSFPSKQEQEKIASFLSSTDSSIEQLTKKEKLLRRYKKGVMQKIFSQEIRFKEDDGSEFPEWVEKKLGSLGSFKGGGTPSKLIKEYWTGDIPWISSSDIIENDIFKININRFINEKSIKESATKIIPKGSVLFISRVGVGKLAINEIELCTSQDFTNFLPKKIINYYLGYYFQFNNNLLVRYSQGTSIKGFTKSDIETLKINLPSLKEQTKIASFLSSIDEKIEQTNRQLKLTKEFKKALLQKMFV